MALNTSSLILPTGSTSPVTIQTGASIRNLENFTFMAWFKVGPNSKSAPGQSAYVERQGGTGNGVRFRFTPVQGMLQFGFTPRDSGAETSYTYKTRWDDRWHHAAFVARIKGLRPTYQIYLDGVKVAEGSLIRGADDVETVADTAPKAITIGNHTRNGGTIVANTAWEGSIDEVIILRQATSQSAISEYLSSKDDWKKDPDVTEEDQEPLKHYWRFDENSGTTTKDSMSSYTASLPSTNRWTKDRPFIGNGADDKAVPSAPSAPTTSNIAYNTFKASWGASTDNVFVQFYELQVSEYSNFHSYNTYDVGTRLSHTVTGLLPTVNYYWRVRAYDAARNASAYTATRSLTTPPLGDNTPPAPPTNLAASYIDHTSFRLTFTASTSTDTAGYRLDISTSPLFDSYLTGYKNLDIGNQTSIYVFSAEPLTSYYARVRAYDAFRNESLESSIVRINTLHQPDVTPPQVVTLHEPTGLSARTITLNWEEGIDNIGVTGYLIDVSKSPDFDTYVSTPQHIWQNMDVGNITRVKIEGLDEETNYFYRIRAYDANGNISDNQEEPGIFRTPPASIYEAGYIHSQEMPNFYQVGSSPEDAASREDEPQEFPVNATDKLYLEFDLSTIVGSIHSAMFMFTPKLKAGNTLGQVKMRIYPGHIDSDQIGQFIYYNILEEAETHEIDMTSLFTGGAGLYTLEISSEAGEFDGYIDTGWEVEGYPASPTGIPLFNIEADPNTSTQPLEMYFSMIRQERRNMQLNPSFEVNTNGWIAVGTAATTAVTSSYLGGQAVQVSGSTIGSGIANNQNSAQIPQVEPLEYYTATLGLRRISGISRVRIKLEAVDNLGGAPTEIGYKDVWLTDSFNRFSVSGLVPQTKSRLKVSVVSQVAGAYVFVLDGVLVERSYSSGAIFNGNTPNARWTGTAHNSVSTIQGAYFTAESPFIGDSNHNNSAAAFIRNLEDDAEGWFRSREPVTVDRELNVYTTRFGPSYGGANLVMNPSFEIDTTFWSGGTRVDDHQKMGDCSYNVPADTWASYDVDIAVEPETDYTINAYFMADGGLITAEAVTYSITDIGGKTQVRVVSNEPEYAINDVWRRIGFTFKTSASEKSMRIRFKSTMPMWMDGVQVISSDVIAPYRDGSILDGVWEGNPHRSSSGIQFNGNETYIVMFEYQDEEGFFDAESLKKLQVRNLFEVPAPPDNVTTVQPLRLSAGANSIDVTAPYLGDDNNNSTVQIEFRRSDSTQWNEIRPAYFRTEKLVRGAIPGLSHGTNYMVRVTFTDPDGVYGVPMGVIEGMITTDYPRDAVDGTINITFGGFTLMGRQDQKIGVTSHDAFGLPDRRVVIEENPRQDGATERQAYWGSKEIRIKGFISGDTRAELDDIRTALVRALSPSQQKLIIDSLSNKGRFYYATCRSLTMPEEGSKNMAHLEWEAVFECADPFAYDISEASVSSFTAPNNGEMSIHNEGDAVVYPSMSITTTSAYPITLNIINKISGDSIRPKVTIVRGDRLIIDSERRSVTKNGIEVDYSGGFIRFPIGGSTLLYVLNATSGTPTIQTDIRWRHRYL